jgi:hypothetical protein
MDWLKRFLKPRQSNFLRLLVQQGEHAVACVDALQAYLKKPRTLPEGARWKRMPTKSGAFSLTS